VRLSSTLLLIVWQASLIAPSHSGGGEPSGGLLWLIIVLIYPIEFNPTIAAM